MLEYTSLRNHFLIAMPSLFDPNFFRSVTFILEHTPDGAMGIVVNHSLNIGLADVLRHLDIDTTHTDAAAPVFAGGPIQPERGFVLHRPHGHWQSSMRLNSDVSITTSRDILEAIAVNQGPTDILVALGYAGWEAGQLEQEIADNTWLCTPSSSEIMFETTPDIRWQAAAQRLLGVDIAHISSLTGHA